VSTVGLIAACEFREPIRPIQSGTVSPTITPLAGAIVLSPPIGGEGEVQPGLHVGIANAALEEVTLESGGTTEKWHAGIWLFNDLCYSVVGTKVYPGDIVEFAGYQIQVLGIDEHQATIAVTGQLWDAPQIEAACAGSTTNRLPNEEAIFLFQDSYTADSLVFTKNGPPWLEEFTTQDGLTAERLAINLQIISSDQSQSWEGTVHEGDIIELGVYRIRILSISELQTILVYSDLSDQDSTP
jgi:hypothetical protein